MNPGGVRLDLPMGLGYKPGSISGKMGRRLHISAGPMARLRSWGLEPANSNGENRTVKRTILFVAGIAILVIALYVGSRLSAQGTAVPRPTSKIAVVNMQLVIEKYKKFEN